MKINLRYQTPEIWLEAIFKNFDTFLQDHASCEKKASAMALMLATKFSNKTDLVDTMVELALEEMQHFYAVWQLLKKRNLSLGVDVKDSYVSQLFSLCEKGTAHQLLDQLIVAGVVELRGFERFLLIGEHHPDKTIAQFYTTIGLAEKNHYQLFFKLAEQYFDKKIAEEKTNFFLDQEAQIIKNLPHQPRLH